MALSDDEVMDEVVGVVDLAAELAEEAEVTPPEEIGVVYAGPHGSVVDGDLTFPLGQPVRTTRDRLVRLREGLPGHRFSEIP
jgi:hypothetical protein